MRFLIPCLTAAALALPAPVPGLFGAGVLAPLLIAASPDRAEAGGEFPGRQGRQGGQRGKGKKVRSKGKHHVNRNADGGRHERRDDNRRHDDRRDRDRDYDRHRDYGRHYDDDWDHRHYRDRDGDFVGGLAVGVAAAVAIGAVVSSLPPGCESYEIRNVAYRRCGEVWYRPQYSGGDVTYVAVDDPR